VQTRRPRCAQLGGTPGDIARHALLLIHLPAVMRSTGCVEEKPWSFLPSTTAGSYPHTQDHRYASARAGNGPVCGRRGGCLSYYPPLPTRADGWHQCGAGDSVDRARNVGPCRYRSSVCSTSESPLSRLVRAIDELAADCRDGAAQAQLAGRIAQVWEMVADLDPELARRRPGYQGSGDGRTHGLHRDRAGAREATTA
jgi:hypothetical protein